jgi:hypothetical protein
VQVLTQDEFADGNFPLAAAQPEQRSEQPPSVLAAGADSHAAVQPPPPPAALSSAHCNGSGAGAGVPAVLLTDAVVRPPASAQDGGGSAEASRPGVAGSLVPLLQDPTIPTMGTAADDAATVAAKK